MIKKKVLSFVGKTNANIYFKVSLSLGGAEHVDRGSYEAFRCVGSLWEYYTK